jgi:uncharacterized protein (TIGR00730 family)
MKKIAVFCGSSVGFDPVYKESAIQLGNAFVQRDITMIYGGGKIGMMGVIAETILSQGGKVIGVIPKLLEKKEVVNREVTELIVTKTMSERKVIMSKLCDGYISLAGGFGTLDELFEGLTMSQLHIEQKPNGILNTNGYFDHLLAQADRMIAEGFVRPSNKDLMIVSDSVDDLLQKMDAYTAPEKTPVIDKVVKNDN